MSRITKLEYVDGNENAVVQRVQNGDREGWNVINIIPTSTYSPESQVNDFMLSHDTTVVTGWFIIFEKETL